METTLDVTNLAGRIMSEPLDYTLPKRHTNMVKHVLTVYKNLSEDLDKGEYRESLKDICIRNMNGVKKAGLKEMKKLFGANPARRINRRIRLLVKALESERFERFDGQAFRLHCLYGMKFGLRAMNHNLTTNIEIKKPKK